MTQSTTSHSADDLAEMIKVNFHLMAENMAALAKKKPGHSAVRLKTTTGGFVVGCVVKAMPE